MTVRPLTASDLDEVVALHRLAYQAAPTGHLRKRSADQMAEILRSQNASAGVFSRGALIAYQLWDRTSDVRFDTRRFRRAADILASEAVLFCKGTVVAPAWQGKGLAGVLERYTLDMASARGNRHRVSEIFVDNAPAIRLFLALGRRAVGLSWDEDGHNLLCCTSLPRPTRLVGRGECPAGDPQQLGRILERYDIFASRGRTALTLVYGDVTAESAADDAVAEAGMRGRPHRPHAATHSGDG